mgnify:CR=1 FL=1
MQMIERVKTVIAKQLRMEISDIADDAAIVEDVGAVSLDIVEMLMSLEEDFGITISEDDAVNIKTVGDIVKAIEAQK